MKVKRISIKAKASEGHPSTVITKYTKPTQGRSSKYYNKKEKTL
jgi:hypothetical protein